MLPDIRAVIAAIFTAVGLLMVSFGLVATFRVAQDNRSGSLQADLAQRGRSPAPVSTEPRATLIIDTPAAPPATPVVEVSAPVETSPAPVVEIKDTPASPPPAEAVTQRAAPPSAERPVGGPLPEHTGSIHTAAPPRDAAPTKAEKAAAKQSRAARLARERRAAAIRRAAEARRAKETPLSPLENIFRQ